jgi:hypothetical protein
MTSVAVGGVPRVNLMPPVEIERRSRARLVRRWFWVLVAVMLAAGILVAGAVALKLFADEQLSQEQARTDALLIELASLSEVSSALAEEAELESFASSAMASDFAWTPVIAEVAAVLPPGVALAGFDLVVGGIPQSDDPSSEVGLTGVVTLESPTAIDMAGTIRSVRALDRVLYADGRLVSSSQGTLGAFRYELTVTFDQTIYSGAYVEGVE